MELHYWKQGKGGGPISSFPDIPLTALVEP